MNNPADLRYLTDKQSQEKIARDILKGIQQFEKEKNSQVISGNAENRN
jgi:N-acetylmuramoyl-L-alanine amidase